MGKERFAGSLVNPEFSLDDAKSYKCELVERHAKTLRDRLTSNLSKGELSSWPIKREEARQWEMLREQGECAILRAEAFERGISMDEMVAKVKGNAALFGNLEAGIAGVSGRHRDAIRALPDFDAVADYDFSAGWPEV
ncbi:hypothetical protein [Massilia sp. X63]|uniref:hypothetical protein n=1 Tax=Massilia sp. X63 TaxID=3237285 RepID=UPI0034DD5E72